MNENYEDNSLERLEARLECTLQPVEPRPEFVADLRGRLTGKSSDVPAAPNLFRFIVYTIAGLVSLILILVTGKRTGPRLVEYLRHMKQEGQPATASPAI